MPTPAADGATSPPARSRAPEPILTRQALKWLRDELEAIHAALTTASQKGDAVEFSRLAKRLTAEGNGLQAALKARAGRPKRFTKLERCKTWLIGYIGTVSREMKLIYRDGLVEHDFEERVIWRALRQLKATRYRTGKGKRQKYWALLPKIVAEILSGPSLLSGPSQKEPTPASIPFKPGDDRRITEMGRRAKQGLPVATKQDADLADGEHLTMLHFIKRRLRAARRKT